MVVLTHRVEAGTELGHDDLEVRNMLVGDDDWWARYAISGTDQVVGRVLGTAEPRGDPIISTWLR